MTQFKPFPCALCGEPVKLKGGPGRTFEFRRGVTLPIPDDFLIPTCISCGEEHLTEPVSRKLCSILRDQFLARQSLHYRGLIDTLMGRHGVSQKQIERACAVTASYLSHILAGNRMASTMLTRLLEAFVACPSEFQRHLAGRDWDPRLSPVDMERPRPMKIYQIPKPPPPLLVADSIVSPPIWKPSPPSGGRAGALPDKPKKPRKKPKPGK